MTETWKDTEVIFVDSTPLADATAVSEVEALAETDVLVPSTLAVLTASVLDMLCVKRSAADTIAAVFVGEGGSLEDAASVSTGVCVNNASEIDGAPVAETTADAKDVMEAVDPLLKLASDSENVTVFDAVVEREAVYTEADEVTKIEALVEETEGINADELVGKDEVEINNVLMVEAAAEAVEKLVDNDEVPSVDAVTELGDKLDADAVGKGECVLGLDAVAETDAEDAMKAAL